MKILLIDNQTQHKRALHEALKGHDVEVQHYHPGLQFNTEGKDLVILSGGGGEGLEIDDTDHQGHLWYEDEMKFVRSCQKPVLGICMGFEVICRAYGSSVEEMSKELKGPVNLRITRKGRKIFPHKAVKQYQAHKWHVRKAPKEFDALAKSATGVEVIKHRDKPILATQFHPELGGSIRLDDLLELATA